MLLVARSGRSATNDGRIVEQRLEGQSGGADGEQVVAQLTGYDPDCGGGMGQGW
jgi:hypothetical protein